MTRARRKTEVQTSDVAVANDENAVFAREGAQATADVPAPAPLVEAPSLNGGPAHQAARKHVPIEHSKFGVSAGDATVHFIDKGDNRAGVGIKIAFPEGAKNRPTAEEKEIIRQVVKGEPGQDSGFSWKRDFGMWHKEIVRDGERPDEVPPGRPVAIRLDAEARVQRLADALTQHAADPVGYAERVKQEREQAAQGRTVA